MTEPVRSASLPRHPLGRLSASVVALASILALPPTVWAAPAAAPADPEPAESVEAQPNPGPRAEGPEVAAVEAALADGDLTTARELAVARREADPSAANYELEASVCEALGDFEQARDAHQAALDQLDADPEADAEIRATIEARLDALEQRARGTQADEPESTHREALDQARADRLAALAPPAPPPPEVVDAPPPKPIVKQWYFWVTLGAIVASAGAIVGLAASNAIDERSTASASARAPTRRPVIPAGGVVFRF